MNILWAMDNPGALRRFERPVVRLVERGHRVHIAYGRVRSSDAVEAVERLESSCPGFTSSQAPRADVGDWAAFVGALRGAIDYARYLEPGAPNSPAMARRVRKLAHPRLAAWLDRSPRARRPLAHAMRFVERRLEVPRAVVEWLLREAPDLVMVTPLVGVASAQADIVRGAMSLGLPVAFPVLSWDNLTSKGLLRDTPDLSLVWNEIQAEELRVIHRVPRERVAVVGASEYEGWGPSDAPSRVEWCNRIGFEPSRRYVLYAGSSPFIAGDETQVFRSWMSATETMRAAHELSVVVRPHPQNASCWASFDAVGVHVWPRRGADPIDPRNRLDQLGSIRHAACVVGINTTLMVEAACFPAPVLSFVCDGTHASQAGTGHFRYLDRASGGHVRVAASLGEHVAHLEQALSEDAHAINAGFAARFLHPRGISGSTDAFVAAVEGLADARRGPLARPPLVGGARFFLKRHAIGFGRRGT